MADRHDTLLAVAAELERRDERIARELELLGELGERAAAVGRRSHELQATLDALPGELAALAREEADAHAQVEAAVDAARAAEARVAELERGLRANEQRPRAERELARAQEGVDDAALRLERLGARRSELLDRERASRVEADELAAVAREAAVSVREVPRVSASGGADPESGLPGLAAWADRVQAALLVARSSLAAERERVIREANELGASVLGEPLGGSSVALVRQRVERALRHLA